RRETLEPHPGVDRGLRQLRRRAVGAALELHEHEVPDLDVTVPAAIRRAGRPAFDARAVVVEDLAARAARARVAHRPEVVGHPEPREPALAHADVVEPDRRRLVIVLVDRAPEPLRRQLELLGQELPREADRVALEVIAEAEVAEHLEEREMARGVADVLEVVVLAARAHAALRARGARDRALLAS